MGLGTDYNVHGGGDVSCVWMKPPPSLRIRSRFVATRMIQDETVLKDIGDRCSHQDCKEFDFLQVKCDKCGQVYCKNHILLDLHDCPGRYQTTGEASPRETQMRSRCALEGCTKLSLESFVADATQTEQRQPALCPDCGNSFCIE